MIIRGISSLFGGFRRLGIKAPSECELTAFPANAGDPNWTKAGSGRSVLVGWVLDTPRARFIWPTPRRILREDASPTHAKSVSYCPAVSDHDARLWDIPCPFDLRLGFKRDAEGRPALMNLDGDRSSIRGKHFSQMVSMVAEKEWRHPNRPIIQIATPYIFLADEPVWMSQMPPISSFRAEQWPGLLISGRLPIHIWPRQMMWAFEWWDTAKELALTRNESWFYVRFETNDPSRHVQVFEADLTPPLREYIDGIASVSNYVSKTYSLFKTAKERRPDRLLVRKVRRGLEGAGAHDLDHGSGGDLEDRN